MLGIIKNGVFKPGKVKAALVETPLVLRIITEKTF
jgi:hypothetical protein